MRLSKENKKKSTSEDGISERSDKSLKLRGKVKMDNGIYVHVLINEKNGSFNLSLAK